ncbi:hypothetical protein GLOIN_2v1772633 [Rhizophagus clarus]|uniref:Uncharacterized protein n=1 Tax=Rhizophagus clarus TaxID=94130 RepID=A0A8H3QRA5_9GLOM|nr:hypothetical protein GLOIN_2v1772633 [Rhizophagus clarus]
MSGSSGTKRGGINKLSKSNNNHSEEEQKNMAIPDILINIARALDRVEAYIDGDTSFNPKNTLDGIRISITTACELMQRNAQDAINMQGLYRLANERINALRNKTTNLRNEVLQSRRGEQMLTLAYNNEVNERRREKAILQRINQRRKAEAELAEFNRAFVFNRYQKWKARELNSRQIIFNLQNNPLLGNMAEARRQPLYDSIETIFSKHEQYTGQEPPDDYLDRIWNSITHLEPNMTALETANAGDFNDAIKCGLLKTKLGGKYLPVPANDPYNGGAINTPATLRTWMRSHYQRETIGSWQVAFQRLTQEKFLPTDSPDTYEKRIRPLLLEVPDGDAQTVGFLKNHLSGDLYTWMRAVAPAGIDAFFTELKNMWLERNPSVSSNGASYSQLPIEPLPVQHISTPKKDDFKIRLARDLQYAGIATDDATLEKFIYDDLQRRLGGHIAYEEDPEDSEEYILEEEEEEEDPEEEIEEDDEYINDDDES